MPQPPLNDNKPTPGPAPLDAAKDADRYREEEPRSFDTDAPPGGHMGSGGDPSEGKRD